MNKTFFRLGSGCVCMYSFLVLAFVVSLGACTTVKEINASNVYPRFTLSGQSKTIAGIGLYSVFWYADSSEQTSNTAFVNLQKRLSGFSYRSVYFPALQTNDSSLLLYSFANSGLQKSDLLPQSVAEGTGFQFLQQVIPNVSKSGLPVRSGLFLVVMTHQRMIPSLSPNAVLNAVSSTNSIELIELEQNKIKGYRGFFVHRSLWNYSKNPLQRRSLKKIIRRVQ